MNTLFRDFNHSLHSAVKKRKVEIVNPLSLLSGFIRNLFHSQVDIASPFCKCWEALQLRKTTNLVLTTPCSSGKHCRSLMWNITM
jgi:hypothetical protein